MPKAKKPQHDDSQVEEIDLSSIDLSSIDLSELSEDKVSSGKVTDVNDIKAPKKQQDDFDFIPSKDEDITDDDLVIK